ncbi:aspartate--ammonia ligase [Peptoniphilaceae bacterium SGI.137]|nr:aspartate--ammonia ligase [Peptoniphilaceae bacterium]MDY3986697.1 aspartate--ammonia ligase [Peptoniphilaceae bacterium]MDY5842159.1 aspartate--ammonia ligase [Peptoniphilaceae bacterium]MDY6147038.1 aspartate--ammonia ligase [Peptoniphilaceae bacterium]
MSECIIPEGYQPLLDRYEIQRAIDFIKKTFQSELSQALNLQRVSAPLFVAENSGLNDTLSGWERPVRFEIPAIQQEAEVVHSLAKWKRSALQRYHFQQGEGLLTDMNAIRRDEELDNLHSIYVDQWDWEKNIAPSDRTQEQLYQTVQKIVDTIANVNHLLKSRFPMLKTEIRREVTFLTSQELEDQYPSLCPEDRENAVTEKYGTVFIHKIGAPLRSGKPHGTRAPDYDDWELNGDILVWNEVLGRAMELSSMGIRVDAGALHKQLSMAGAEEKESLPFHQALLNGDLPQTMGGGIGQSRLCMFLIGSAHIGEVQASLWDPATISACKKAGVSLL